MNYRYILVLLLVLPLLVGADTPTWDITRASAASPQVETNTYGYGSQPQDSHALVTLDTNVAVHGTMWVAERKARLKMFKPMGWGTVIKLKDKFAPGDEWVHISVPYITKLYATFLKLYRVTFCAQSTAGAVTKPTAVHLWATNDKFYTGAISWPSNNNINCHDVLYPAGIGKDAVGISVLLHFDKPADKITLYKAWIDIRP